MKTIRLPEDYLKRCFSLFFDPNGVQEHPLFLQLYYIRLGEPGTDEAVRFEWMQDGVDADDTSIEYRVGRLSGSFELLQEYGTAPYNERGALKQNRMVMWERDNFDEVFDHRLAHFVSGVLN